MWRTLVSLEEEDERRDGTWLLELWLEGNRSIRLR